MGVLNNQHKSQYREIDKQVQLPEWGGSYSVFTSNGMGESSRGNRSRDIYMTKALSRAGLEPALLEFIKQIQRTSFFILIAESKLTGDD